MARPLKTGLDYFSLDCHMDDKVKLVQAAFGLKGFAIVIKLYQKIYGEEGFFVKWTHDVNLLFASENDVSENFVFEVVRACIQRDIFNSDMYNKFSILTSSGIQRSYFSASSRRKEKNINHEYILLNVPIKTVNDNNNQVNVDNNKIKAISNTQSKVYIDIIGEFEESLAKTLSPKEIDLIISFTEDYAREVIICALNHAVSKNGRSVSYVSTILANWYSSGVKTVDDAQKQIDAFERKIAKKNEKSLEDYETV